MQYPEDGRRQFYWRRSVEQINGLKDRFLREERHLRMPQIAGGQIRCGAGTRAVPIAEARRRTKIAGFLINPGDAHLRTQTSGHSRRSFAISRTRSLLLIRQLVVNRINLKWAEAQKPRANRPQRGFTLNTCSWVAIAYTSLTECRERCGDRRRE